MKKIIVRYRVKPDKVEENKQLIRKVFEELTSTTPAGLQYSSYALADGVSFVHIASITTADEINPLQSSPAFKEFTSTIKDRCEEAPVASEATTIGAYNF